MLITNLVQCAALLTWAELTLTNVQDSWTHWTYWRTDNWMQTLIPPSWTLVGRRVLRKWGVLGCKLDILSILSQSHLQKHDSFLIISPMQKFRFLNVNKLIWHQFSLVITWEMNRSMGLCIFHDAFDRLLTGHVRHVAANRGHVKLRLSRKSWHVWKVLRRWSSPRRRRWTKPHLRWSRHIGYLCHQMKTLPFFFHVTV